MKKLLLLTLALLCILNTAGARTLKPRLVFEKYLFAEGVDPKARYLDQLMVKFFDEDMVRLQNGTLVSTNGRNSLSYVQDFLARHPEIRIEHIISQPEAEYQERTRWAEERSGIDLVDLFSFYNFRLPRPAADPKALLADILNAPEVEIAYYESIPVEATCQDLGNVTPNFIPQQDYHDAAPTGVDLPYAQTAYGADVVDGDGTSTWTSIVEWGPGFHLGHEDFTNPVNATPEVAPNTTSYHGTAVMGILGACDDNNVGVLGFLADQTMRGYDVNALASHADVYNRVNSNLVAGEVSNSSWGYFSNPMPPGQSCPCNPGQNGMVPAEYVPSVKAAIQAGVAQGIFYFLSAGNGCTNLDAATFGTTFRWSTETGSCYVGGVESALPHNFRCYTCFGERVTLNAWAQNVTTTGYGGLFGGTGMNEYYTATFNGTSSASPIVAGVAGVVNNVYRNLNGGSNLTPAQMRDRLDDYGTVPGSTPGGPIGVMPNLRGILAPELNPDFRTGWFDYVVPRNAGDADGSSATLPATLNSSPSPTYWNSAIENTAQIGVATPGYWRLYRDDNYIVWSNIASLGPGGRTYTTNIQGAAANVRGGRHTIRLTCDPLAEVEEYDEGNNNYARQFVWNPQALSTDSPLLLSRGPDMWVTDQPGAYANCDGYSGSGFPTGWWDIFAVMSTSTAVDYDARIYSEAIGSTNGFDDYEINSAGVTPIDFVGINNNVQAGSLLAGAFNWNESDEDYLVEGQTSVIVSAPVGRNLASSGSIGTNEIFDNFEFFADPANGQYTIELEVTSGNANLVISVFGPDDAYFGISNRNFFANSGGAGASELLNFTPAAAGWYGVVIHKYSNASWGESANYNLYIGRSQFDLTHNLNSGWSHRIVVRQIVGSSPAVLPATLTGNVNTNYLNAAYINQGQVTSPADLNDRFYLDGPGAVTTGGWSAWAPGTTTSWVNQGPVFVFGGRHSVGDSIDVFQEGAEWLENNNRHDEQFVWTPFAMTNGVTYLTTNPGPNWANAQSAVPFAAANQDGWRFTGSNRWSGVAGCPVDGDDDYNLHLFNPSTGSENGFDARLVPSWVGANGITEWVAENGNVNGAVAFDVGVCNNYSWPTTPSQGAYRMWQSNSLQDLTRNAVNGPFSMGIGVLINTFDLVLTAGDTVRFILDNLGAVDLGLAIYDASDLYGSRSNNGTIINAAGDGADETTSFVATSTGRHGIVVFKHDYTDLGLTQYRLIIGNRTPRAPAGLVMEVMDNLANPIVTRVAWTPVTQDILGQPITVDHYKMYYTTDDTNVFPAGWLWFGDSPNAGPVNVFISTALPYARFAVTAVDADGFVVGGVGLPAGFDPTGLHESDLPGSSATLDVRMVPAEAGTTAPVRE